MPGIAPPEADCLLVVAGVDDGPPAIGPVDRSAQPWRRLAALDDVAQARVDRATRRVLLIRKPRAGLWQVDLDLDPASVRQVDGDRPVAGPLPPWNVAADGQVDFLDRGPACAARLARAVPAPRHAAWITRRLPPTPASASVPRECRFRHLAEWVGGDIGFMALQVPPEEHWPGRPSG